MFKSYPDSYKTIDWTNLKGWSFSEGGERVDLSKYKDDKKYDVYAVYTETPYVEGDDPAEQPKDELMPDIVSTKSENQFIQSIKDFADIIGLGNLSTAWQIGILLVGAAVIIQFVFGRR